jgi:hypothetical protein
LLLILAVAGAASVTERVIGGTMQAGSGDRE